MKPVAHVLVAIIANAIGLVASAYFITGFGLNVNAASLLVLAAILTALNFFLKPILKLFLGPIIVLTLGLGLIVVNALILYVLDILSQNLTIDGIPALIYASVIIGLVNFVFHFATKE